MGMGLNPGDVEKDEEGIKNMSNLGKTILWLGEALAPHKNSFPR
jgi:hypothetical protein